MYCFVDCETTGLKPEYHEIIELAIIIEQDGKIIETFYSKVKPQYIERANERALQINGYNAKEWRDAPGFETIAPTVRRMLSSCGIWIGHNPRFDFEFIQEAFFRVGEVPTRARLIDTTVLVHEHLTDIGCSGLSMDAVRHFLCWDKSKAHTALADTKQVRELYHKLNGCTWLDRQLMRLKARFFQRC